MRPDNYRPAPYSMIFQACFVGVLSIGALLMSVGCAGLRIPQIDPTGACLFAPYPENSTEITCGCLGCLSGQGGCLRGLLGHSCGCLSGQKCGLLGCGGCLGNKLPRSAFPQPPDPPRCDRETGPAAAPELCIPAPGCEHCADGPPAVLLGCETRMADYSRLPTHGKRGCILLSPQRIVAPVGGEVILLSGVCGDDGHLMQREPLEWMLTPESVGHFIQVGNDAPGLIHRLAKTPLADKRSGSYARGVTSTKQAIITRGNKTMRDDVRVEKGQTWLTISSPTEGTSRVTVMAPESDCWDQRKATATIYWIDASWQFPRRQLLTAGTPGTLTTRVTRSEGSIPAVGWTVRYEILNPELATFAPGGSPVAEVGVDESGNATIEIIPNPETAGTATVAMSVVRPTSGNDNMPRMTLGQGQTTVRWGAPQLRARVAAPRVAGFEQPFVLAGEIGNPGDLPARNVSATLELPPGVSVESADSFAKVIGNQIVWQISEIPPLQQWEIQATLSARAPVLLRLQARADDSLFAEDSTQVDVFRPSLAIEIAPEEADKRPVVGEEQTFNIDVVNIGDRPLMDVKLESRGGPEMVHLQTGGSQAFKDKDDGPLQPGEKWKVAVTFVPTAAGERCVTAIATAAGGQTAEARGCVLAVNPIPATPAINARIESRPTWSVSDDQILFKYRILNSGQETLRNVRVSAVYDPQLEVLQATVGMDDSELEQYKLNWNIQELAPGRETLVEARFRAVDVNPQSLMVLTVQSDEGATAADDYRFAIVPGQPPATAPAPRQAPLPESTDPPTIPSTPTDSPPVSAAPSPADRPRQDAAPPIAADTGRLRLQMIALDNPAEVDAPIRYQLVVANDRAVADSQVEVRFALPAGVSIDSISQTLNPGGEAFRPYAGMIYLPEIRQILAGESIAYTIVLRSNQPQAMRIEIEARSRLQPEGISTAESIRVLPRQ